MTQYEMEQNLENHRFQSVGIVDNILTMGIVNPTLENVVRNSLAKDSSAAFQMALKNGGIYRNNTFLGGNGLYGIVRKITPKSLRSGESAHYGGIGPIQFNKFSAGSLDTSKSSPLSDIAKNIADNNPDWNVEDDIIATGFGFQNKGYKEFFDQLDNIGFELNKANSMDVNLTKHQMKTANNLTNGKFKSMVGNDFKTIYSSRKNVQNYIKENVLDRNAKVKYSYLKKEFEKQGELANFQTWYEKNKGRSLAEVQDMFDGNMHIEDIDSNMSMEDIKIISEFREQYTDKTGKFDLEKAKAGLDVESRKNAVKAQQIYDEYDDYTAVTKAMKGNWSAENLSDDLYNQLHDDFSKIIKDGINLSDTEQMNAVNGFLDDFFKLEKSFNKFGKRTTSTFYNNFSSHFKQIQNTLNIKNIKAYAKKNNITLSEAMTALKKEATESFVDFIKNNADDAFKNFSDDAAKHFATKTGFQKLMGNKVTSFLTGIKGGLAGFLWQLPVMVATATASINQENAIQNFVSSYLYNPKIKEMYNNEATDRSMQIASNIHFSNIQDTQSIIIKHNTAERYLNDLDPINIDNDYSSKSFDLNPRNN